MRDAPRDFQLFLNGLKILRGLDRHVLVDAGVLANSDHYGWVLARDFSAAFFREVCRRNDQAAAALWRLIESRQSLDVRGNLDTDARRSDGTRLAHFDACMCAECEAAKDIR